MTLDPNIVLQRKAYAPRLLEIINRSSEIATLVRQLKASSEYLDGRTHGLQDAIDRQLLRLERMSQRVEVRHQRFSQGLVTVAVGGIEKSGKTTLLKTLTGIENLPTANERCTAVCCEIIYDPRQTFDLEFHSEVSFCASVLTPLIDDFNRSLVDLQHKDIHALPQIFSLNQFLVCSLPHSGLFSAGTKTFNLIKDLTLLQKQATELMEYVGSNPTRDIPLDALSKWVSHNDNEAAKARVASVARCIIYTPFQGGSDNLRWIDTPGVDDPSPLAREKTLKSVGQDADLLVVGTMPRDKPSPTESFVNFWTSIHNLPDEINLMDRLLILLNWKKDADPEKVNLIKHQRILERDHAIPSELFCGPVQATSHEDVQEFMSVVNQHLRLQLPKQDALVVQAFENELKSILAEIRTSVFDVARRMSPSDGSQIDLEYSLFEDWFRMVPEGGRPHEGFWPNLQQLFVSSIDEIAVSEEVTRAQTELREILRSQADTILKNLPKEADMCLKFEKSGGIPPIASYMQDYASGAFSTLVNKLAKQVGEFGPLMQQCMLKVLKQAGLAGMLTDEDAAEALSKLLEQLRDHVPDLNSPPAVLEALEELAGLKKSLQYVYRWEMRPAIDFLSPLQWGKTKAVAQLAALMESNGSEDGRQKANNLRKFFETHKIPGMEDSMKDHAWMFESLCKFALQGINIVLDSGRCSLSSIADDFVRDLHARMALSAYSEQAWRKLLRPLRGEILGDQLKALRANSQKLRRFSESVEALGAALP